mmetsp:Transcript_64953/g.120919  ORF Transcript_64953/g.120919 Transcript_64953/m.120919 type:complete len:185 (-) Transcript_64953:106-660(-)
MSDDDDDSEEEDDERIMDVLTYSSRHTDSEVAEYLKQLGGQDAKIYKVTFPNKPTHAKVHFLLQGAVCLDNEAEIPPQLKEKKALLKQFVDGNEDIMKALILMFELYYKEERPSVIEEGSKEFGDTLRVLWEMDALEQSIIEDWHVNEVAVQEFYPPFFSQEHSIAIRESARDFVIWLQEGEDP